MPTGNEVEVTLCLTDGIKLTEIKNLADIATFLEQHEEYVKVVRCKDCKWFEKWYKELPPWDTGYYCTRPNQQSANLLPTDFCSYGVKRNE